LQINWQVPVLHRIICHHSNSKSTSLRTDSTRLCFLFRAAPSLPCTNFGEFGAASQAVTEACCDDTAHPCVGGLPTVCNRECGEVLPPFHAACGDLLANIGMDTTVDEALATCGGGH
jgi:hypothetical protein